MTKVSDSDYIKREDAIKATAKAVGRILYDADAVMRHVMDTVPSADVVERKPGHWIVLDEARVKCPYCNKEFDYSMNFCGACGADMRERKDNE